MMATPIDYTPGGAAVYVCNPAINTECSKTNCYINGGPCARTLDPKFALTEGTGNMIAWFNVGWGGPKLHKEKDENDNIVYQISDPVLNCTAEGEMLVACHEVDPDTGFDGWITPRSSWVIENVTHWAPLPKRPEGMR